MSPARFEPPVSEAAVPFWDATRDGRLLIPWCVACGRAFWFPRAVCPRCLGSEIEWREASGFGRVYAFCIEHRPLMPEVFGDQPYAVALVELDEGVRLMTNVVGVAAPQVHVGQHVTVRWEPLSDGRRLPLFTPVREG